MDSTVEVTIPVEPEAAAALADARTREAIGRLVIRVLRPRSGPSPLAQAIAEMKADARAAGLTDADIDAELAAYNAECRDPRAGIGAVKAAAAFFRRRARSATPDDLKHVLDKVPDAPPDPEDVIPPDLADHLSRLK